MLFIDWLIANPQLWREREGLEVPIWPYFFPHGSHQSTIFHHKKCGHEKILSERIKHLFVFTMISNPWFLYPCLCNSAYIKDEQWTFEWYLEEEEGGTQCAVAAIFISVEERSFCIWWGTSKKRARYWYLSSPERKNPIKLKYPTFYQGYFPYMSGRLGIHANRNSFPLR